MKANELMIGDWMIGGSGKQFKIGIIDPDFLYWNDIKPIPLTPEILEKNGFKEYNGYGYAGNKGYCFKGFYINHDFFIKIANIDCKVNFIHELQHALRLCGIEKTIEL